MEAAAEKSHSATVLIFRHGPIIIYTRLPAGGTYYPICMFPTNGEYLIAFLLHFLPSVYGYLSSCPRAHCTPPKKRAYSALHPQACTYICSSTPISTYQVQSLGFLKIVYSLQEKSYQSWVRAVQASSTNVWCFSSCPSTQKWRIAIAFAGSLP